MSLLRSDLAYRPFTPLTPQHVQCMEMACSASSCEEKMKSITEASPAIHPFTNIPLEDSDSESEDSDDSNDVGLGPEIAQCEPPLTNVHEVVLQRSESEKAIYADPERSIPTFPASFQNFHRGHHRTAQSAMK